MLTGLQQRPAELAVLIDSMFPAETNVEKILLDDLILEFADVNPCAKRIFSWEVGVSSRETFEALKSPWHQRPMTLTGQSKIIMRATMVHQGGAKTYLRFLQGWEYMALVGWGLDWWEVSQPVTPSDICANMAGNAFSAFAVGPIILVGLTLLGIPGTEPPESQSDSDKSGK